MDDILLSVLDIVRRHVEIETPFVLDDPDIDLVALGVGSLQMVSFIFDLEESFSLEFPATMIVSDNFRTARTVAACIRSFVRREAM